MEKKNRRYVAIGILNITLGIIGFLFMKYWIYLYDLPPMIYLTICILILLTGIGFILNVYLKGGFNNDNPYLDYTVSKDFERSTREHIIKLDKLYKNFKEKYDEIEDLEIDSEIVQELINSKINDITTESVFENIKNKFEIDFLREKKEEALEDELYWLKNRIEKETTRTTRIANTNLLIGFFTTFLAIFFLWYSLLGSSQTIQTNTSFIFHFIPRFSLSVFIEMFSFFFLRIYKKNLDDIKYLNNERTNIDLKLVALRTSILYDDKDSLKNVINDLSKTERNYVLKKGESTVNIEMNKMENKSYEKLVDGLMKVINKN